MKTLSALALLLASCLPTAFAQTRPEITGVAFFRSYATDKEATAKVYSGYMGYVRTTVGDTDYYSVSPQQWFEIKPLPTPTPASRMEAVGLTTRDVKGMAAYLKAKGFATIPQKTKEEIGVKDPEGNLIIFVQSGMKHPGSGAPAPRSTSHRIIHAGFIVRDQAKEDAFYKDILGFHPYWHGGRTPDRTDYASVQVPEGSDWIEYMLNQPETPTLAQYGVMDHFSLGVESIDTVLTGLEANGCTEPMCKSNKIGVDGKMQLNMYDPDKTRVEYMEFKPRKEPCCSPFVGKHPSEVEDK